jgi:hypothetical protein
MTHAVMTEINSWDEVPAFANEDEEHEYWSTHCLGPGILSQMKHRWEEPDPDPRLPSPRPVSIRLRLEGETYVRLRRLAHRRGVAYKALLRELLVERIWEEERREGLVGAGAEITAKRRENDVSN